MTMTSRIFIRASRAKSLVVLGAAIALAGCGNSGGNAKQAAAVQAERFVFISAKDCAESGKLKLQQCGDAIDAAIAAHNASAPTYKSLYSCETTEGGDRCERTDNKSYRPRLVAFLFTVAGDKAGAEPLYPPPGSEAGLRMTEKKKIVLTTDDTVTYSTLAIAAYESNRGDANNPASTGKKSGF